MISRPTPCRGADPSRAGPSSPSGVVRARRGTTSTGPGAARGGESGPFGQGVERGGAARPLDRRLGAQGRPRTVLRGGPGRSKNASSATKSATACRQRRSLRRSVAYASTSCRSSAGYGAASRSWPRRCATPAAARPVDVARAGDAQITRRQQRDVGRPRTRRRLRVGQQRGRARRRPRRLRASPGRLPANAGRSARSSVGAGGSLRVYNRRVAAAKRVRGV